MNNKKLIDLAKELQALAQAGVFYSKDPFDIEKFERIRDISAEIMSDISDTPVEKVLELFCNETGYQTPKLDVRAAMFKDDKVLLVKDNRGNWALPGGWVDVTTSVKEGIIKECREETGRNVAFNKLVSVVDQSQDSMSKRAYSVIKMYMIVDELGGEFKENHETVATEYFALDELPELGRYRSTVEQIELCFKAKDDENWKTIVE